MKNDKQFPQYFFSPMKIRIRKYFLLLILPAGFFSCRTFVDHLVPDSSHLMAVNGIFQEDSTWKISVYQPTHILDNMEPEPVSNANVRIYEDGVFLTNLSYNSAAKVYVNDQLYPVPGKQYSISIDAPGKNSVESWSSIPAQAESVFMECKKDAETSQFGNYDSLFVKIKDRINEKNYYEVEIWAETEYYYLRTIGDTVFYSWKYAFVNEVITDELFDGKEETFRYRSYSDSRSTNKSRYVLVVSSITPEYFRYKRSVLEQRNSFGTPFAEPVIVPGNIKNGLGIFAGINTVRKVYKRN
jgi:hypothetical protein